VPCTSIHNPSIVPASSVHLYFIVLIHHLRC
jgi:hypothetical protein